MFSCAIRSGSGAPVELLGELRGGKRGPLAGAPSCTCIASNIVPRLVYWYINTGDGKHSFAQEESGFSSNREKPGLAGERASERAGRRADRQAGSHRGSSLRPVWKQPEREREREWMPSLRISPPHPSPPCPSSSSSFLPLLFFPRFPLSPHPFFLIELALPY